ncbi:hypothetical protein [Microbacterium sp. 13-71-7]|uniref:hypothetical protein n=1 Tax=Microbacterium sp. 13-71-7 TaxID=1970399 RepID=UPI000BC6B55C|nr:hypothetical protein [Microbacterium sp. 13-71-7]OZB85065.1 MAG: hypothetical protein B7X32_04925 [Microbacterium sp. 13-71-7]
MSFNSTPLRGDIFQTPAGTVFTVRQRRKRASGVIEVLLVSLNGASRWVDTVDLAEKYTPVE